MKSVKLFLLTLIIVCFINLHNANAQYKFSEIATVSVELTLVQNQLFKDVIAKDKEVMLNNKVKRIHFNNSRGEVQYLYNKNGQITEFSITDKDGDKTFETFEYDANNNPVKYFYGTQQNDKIDGVTYFYKYDEKGRMINATTDQNVMMSPAKDYTIVYYNKNFPDAPGAIRYYKGNKTPEGTSMIESPLYESVIESDDKGRITLVIDKDKKEMIKNVYTESGVNVSYLGDDFITKYTIKDNVITHIEDNFTATDFTYKDNGLLDVIKLTLIEDKTEKTFNLEYEFY
ncbi:MAG: RHS repeat protein [Bacteroidetes bacterium]|nr:RHS repeat protein [Bacteroidota bacterium]